MMTKILQGMKKEENDLIKCSDMNIASRLDGNNAERSHAQRCRERRGKSKWRKLKMNDPPTDL
jgi:hypothetical protein